jgi:DHA1 family multidrug resistance protein-like MFS transporter
LESAVQKVYDATRHNIRRHMNSFHQNMRDMHAHGIHLHLHALRIEATAAGLPINIDRPAQFHPSFYLGSILFALATIIALLALKDRKADEREGFEHHEADCGHGEPMTWAAFVEAVKSVPHLMLIAFVAFFGIGCIALLVKVFALDELGISETEFGLLVLWPAVVIGALAIPLGQISDKFGQVRSVRVGFLVAASGMWAIIFLFPIHAVQDIALMAGGTLLGLGFVISFPAWMALLTTIGGEERRGTVIGAVSTAQGVGMLCGAELGGILYRRASADPHIAHLAPFAASAVFLTAAALMTFFMISSHTKDAKPVDA